MADITDATKPYTQFAAFRKWYDMLVERQHLPEPKDGYDTARALWTWIIQAGYFNLLHDHGWCIYTTPLGSVPHNDPLVVVVQRLNEGRDDFELCGVLVADDYVRDSWEKREEQVVGFVKSIAHQKEHQLHEDGVFAIVPKGTMVRFYWLDSEGVLKPYPLVGEQVFQVKEDEKEIMGVLRHIHGRFAGFVAEGGEKSSR
ncbi:hypothetical protein QBC36DRAFT_334980 [Triangularia setosa]|uniref:Uncharacterized protein n=1 Tax=Triangularia setosa TaxID=2587417 RepID=A0AAN7A4K4_9PEZI|nr:hypothetical protein QBC36DRAFT_334980 [Podospora setosa]